MFLRCCLLYTALGCLAQTWTPVLSPDCSALTPQPCFVIPNVGSDGEFKYDSYLVFAPYIFLSRFMLTFGGAL
jgi:hypothetical protein